MPRSPSTDSIVSASSEPRADYDVTRKVYERLSDSVDPVVFDVPPVNSEPSTILEWVEHFLLTPRTQGGLDGRLRFTDLDRLLATFQVDVFHEDMMDDIWCKMCDAAGCSQPPASISHAFPIAEVLRLCGAKLPSMKLSSTKKSTPKRCMSPTVSSNRKALSHVRANSPPKKSNAASTKLPAVFERLVAEATVIRERQLQNEVRKMNMEREGSKECTFTPTVHTTVQRPASGIGSSYTAATQSSLLRMQRPLHVEVDERDTSIECSQPNFRRRDASAVPQEVPVGYVEAVARLRRCALAHSKRQHGFEESLRTPQSTTASANELMNRLTGSSILRIPVPSLGEVVEVRLAS